MMKRSLIILCTLTFTLSLGCWRSLQPSGRQSKITGRITGFKSKTPLLPRVDVYELGRSDVPRRVQAAPDGSFEVTTDQIGMIRLGFTGVMHEAHSVYLLLQEPSEIKLDVRVAPYDWEDAPQQVMVIGDFNNYSRTVGYALMVRRPDGTYAAELANLAGKKLGYRLVGLIKGSTRSVPGTMYDDLATDLGGNYISYLTVRNGGVRIEFDSALLPRSNMEPGFTFSDSNSLVARIARLQEEMRRRQNQYAKALNEFTAFGRSSRRFRYDWSGTVAGLRKEIAGEQDPLVREMLYMSILDLHHMQGEEVDAATAREALAAIPPDSPLWEQAPSYLMLDAVKLASGLDTEDKYLEAVLDTHPSREVKAIALEQFYLDALSQLDMERAGKFYGILTTQFDDLVSARIRARPPQPRIAAGRIMPQFSFTSVDNPSEIITNATFKGKVYLIDFWATWSNPSLAERSGLETVYEKYKNRGFDILSLSFDRTAEDVRNFRARRQAMPWRHGFIGREELRRGSEITAYFEVPAIPRAILIDRNGRIVSAGDPLAGDSLESQIRGLVEK